MPSRIALLIAALAVLAYTSDFARAQDMTLVDANCMDESHEPNTDAEKACDSVYDYLLNHAAEVGYNTQKKVTIGGDTYYGEEACDGTISEDACTKCLGLAYDIAISRCLFSNGAHVKFKSCRFRVENYAFDSNW